MLGTHSIDFTLFFDVLTRIRQGALEDDLLELFPHSKPGAEWLRKWESLSRVNPDEAEVMRLANPAVIARNHRVEQVIAAANAEDLEPMRRLCTALSTPYTLTEENADLAIPPQPDERVTQTFCGT